MGLQGEDQNKYVLQQQALERKERAREREAKLAKKEFQLVEKDKERAEKDREREFQVTKLKAEIELSRFNFQSYVSTQDGRREP